VSRQSTFTNMPPHSRPDRRRTGTAPWRVLVSPTSCVAGGEERELRRRVLDEKPGRTPRAMTGRSCAYRKQFPGRVTVGPAPRIGRLVPAGLNPRLPSSHTFTGAVARARRRPRRVEAAAIAGATTQGTHIVLRWALCGRGVTLEPWSRSAAVVRRYEDPRARQGRAPNPRREDYTASSEPSPRLPARGLVAV
jgi:hypothetical protein